MNSGSSSNKLKALLQPSSIAIVGASEGENRATLAYRNLRILRYQGKIYPVNPKYQELYGLPCYPNLQSIPEPVDCALISIPNARVLQAIKDAAENGVKGATVISSGFGEGKEEGTDLGRELVRLAKESGLKVCGPNCLGVISPAHRSATYGFTLPQPLVPGRVGAVMQSGGLLHAIALELCRRGVGFSHLISSGNESVVNSADYFEYLVDDPGTGVIIGFIEGIRDPEKFVRVAEEASQRKKPLIMVKIGRSEKGRRAAVAHTGSLAGSDSVQDALFRQKGVIRVNDIDELIETTVLFSMAKIPRGSGLAVVTTSGGEAGLYSDVSAELGLEFPDLSKEAQDELHAILPDFATVANPLDTTGAAALDPGTYSRCIGALAAEKEIDVIAVSQMDIGEEAIEHNPATKTVVTTLVDFAGKSEKTLLLFTPNSRGAGERIGGILAQKGLPLLVGARSSLKAIQNLFAYGRFLREGEHRKSGQAVDFAPVGKAVLTELEKTLRDSRQPLTERESKSVLARYGVPVTQEALARSASEAANIAEEIGFPVAMKVESPQISHKTEAGGVVLNITSSKQAAEAFQRVTANALRYNPQAEITGVIVSEMVPPGLEVIAGLTMDPQFGPTVLFGLGGVLVEVFRDVVLRVAPVTRREAMEMVGAIKGFKLLEGYRGRPAYDVDALAEVLVKMSHLGLDLRDAIEEVDVNPLIVLPEGQGIKAVDALIVPKGLKGRR